MDLGERLKYRRESLGLTQSILESKVRKIDPSINFTRITLSQLENATQKSMRDKLLLALSKALDCRPDWLVYGIEPISANDTTKTNYNVEPGPDVHQMVPEINWVQAGSWTTVSDNTPLDQANYHPCPVKCSPLTFALRVKGDSMLTRFEDGDLIYVDPEKLEPKSGQFIVALLEDSNEATFKQFLELDGRKMLKALNPDYPAELRFLSINGNCRVVGTVVSHVKPV